MTAQELIGGVEAVAEREVPAHVGRIDRRGPPGPTRPIDDPRQPSPGPGRVLRVVVAMKEAAAPTRRLRGDLDRTLPEPPAPRPHRRLGGPRVVVTAIGGDQLARTGVD